MNLLDELQRRKIVQWTLGYAAGAWVFLQALGFMVDSYDWPHTVSRIAIVVVAVGFFVTMVLAWYHGERGKQRMPRNEVLLLAVLLALAGGLAWRTAHAPVTVSSSAASSQSPVASIADPHSIAVLPFVNMSADPAQEFFSDGIAEELLNRLAQFSDLKVAARTSAFQFKGKNLDVADIGRKLKVSHVLEGSVRKQGAQLRITAQLIDTASGYHLWSHTYDGDATDVFKVQDEISTAIADALEAKISGRPAQGNATRQANPEAYDDYLQGRALIAKRVGDNAQRAVEAFDRAIAGDPSYSPAHSGRAFALTIGSYWGDWLPREQAFAMARTSIDEALRLDPDNAEAYMVRGTIGIASLRIVEGKADLDRALVLAPGSVDVINFYGDMLEFIGDMRGAETMKRKAMALDPLAFIHPTNLAQILASEGRMTESLQYAERGAALGAVVGAGSVFGNVFEAQLRAGRVADAQRTYDRACTTTTPDTLARCPAMQVMLLAALGRTVETERAMANFVAAVHAGKPMRIGGRSGPIGLAFLYEFALHDPHRAAAELRASLEKVQWFAYDKLLLTPQGQKLPEEISNDPDWLAAWNDPRLKEWMDAYRANLAKFRKGE